MSGIELKIRNLQTGEQGTVTLESEPEALTWLRARPPFVDVMGLITRVPEDVSQRLRAAVRPHDAAERALAKQAEEEMVAQAKARAEADQRRAEEASAARRTEAKSADPNRPMQIRWMFDAGMQTVDKDDPREITVEARAAVLAWVAERNDWVRDRGQMVGDATCTVLPGEVPEGTERVVSGRFVPVTAAAPQSKPS